MKYLEQLTWLRGLAAFFVIVTHTLFITGKTFSIDDEPSYFFPLAMLNLGGFGVSLFFCLSGCTLYLSNSNQLNGTGILRFYIKRVFRIWPAFFCSLLVYLLFIYCFKILYGSADSLWIKQRYYVDYSLSDVVNYLLLIFNFTGPSDLFNGAYWSLPVEFQYYLLFPLAIFLLKYISWLGLVILGSVFYLYPSFFIIDMRLELFNLAFVFFGGVLIGDLYQRVPWRLPMFAGVFLISSVFLLISLYVNNFIDLPNIPGYYQSSKNTWRGLFSLIVLFLVLITEFNINDRLKKFLKNYGDISYSTYLYHNLFLGISILIINAYGIYGGSLKLSFVFLFTLIGTYFFANFSYKYIELPFLNYGRMLARIKK